MHGNVRKGTPEVCFSGQQSFHLQHLVQNLWSNQWSFWKQADPSIQTHLRSPLLWRPPRHRGNLYIISNFEIVYNILVVLTTNSNFFVVGTKFLIQMIMEFGILQTSHSLWGFLEFWEIFFLNYDEIGSLTYFSYHLIQFNNVYFGPHSFVGAGVEIFSIVRTEL